MAKATTKQRATADAFRAEIQAAKTEAALVEIGIRLNFARISGEVSTGLLGSLHKFKTERQQQFRITQISNDITRRKQAEPPMFNATATAVIDPGVITNGVFHGTSDVPGSREHHERSASDPDPKRVRNLVSNTIEVDAARTAGWLAIAYGAARIEITRPARDGGTEIEIRYVQAMRNGEIKDAPEYQTATRAMTEAAEKEDHADE